MSRVFNGSSDFLERTGEFLETSETTIGISLWFKPSGIASYQLAGGGSDLVGTTGYICACTDNSGANAAAQARDMSATTIYNSTAGTIVDGVWQHIYVEHVRSGVNASNSRRVWYNGVAGTAETTSVQVAAWDATTNEIFTVGTRATSTRSGYFNGKMAHLAVYNTAGGDSRASALQSAFPDTVTSGLKAYWDFLSSSLTDSVGSFVLTATGTSFDGADDPSLDSLIPPTLLYRPHAPLFRGYR